MACDSISTIKLLRHDDVWHPRIGAPRKNRNRWKTGMHTAEMKRLRKDIHALHARAKEAMARANDSNRHGRS